MLFSIFNIFFNAIIVILLIRYFVERYQYYGFGPLMVVIVQLSQKIVRPMRNAIPVSSRVLRDNLPLIAILLVLFIRGFAIWLLGTDWEFAYLAFYSGGFNLFTAMLTSFTMGILLIGELLIAFLFASLMMSRRGIAMHGNGAYTCFRERTFAVFQKTGTWVKTNNLLTLFLISSLIIWFLTAIATGFFSALSFLSASGGEIQTIVRFFLLSTICALFEILSTLIHVYLFALFLSIIASWIAVDQFSVIIQILRSMTEPYLLIWRRLCPWARIDFIDLSPIFGFLVLYFVLYYLDALQYYILINFSGFSHSIQPFSPSQPQPFKPNHSSPRYDVL